MKFKFKEYFHQNYDAEEKIPPHWVVQYYSDESTFPMSMYFVTEKEALRFIDENLETVDP